MVVAYTLKGLEITDEQKQYLEKRMQKFKFFYDHILNIKVIAEESRGRISLEIKVMANHDTFFASDTQPSWEAACDSVTDKIEKEIKRYKEKKVKEHHKSNHKQPPEE
ncbi:MAG: ribosome hibernation-promoting factor, HPF/YfiA family [Brevinematales bacterium]